MEGNSTLKQLLDSLFGKLDLKSWTVHENDSGTVCTLRFGDTGGTNSGDTHTTTFKRKSPYQLNRDRQRKEHHMRVKPKTRSETHAEHSESARCGDNDSMSLSNTSLSAESTVHSDPHTSFRLDTHSPGACAPVENSTTTPLPAETVPVVPIDLPSVPDSIECELSDSCSVNDGQMLGTPNEELADTFTNHLFREHLTHRSEISFKDIRCHDCRNHVTRPIINIPRWRGIRMLYCEQCDLYMCSKCAKLDKHKLICNNPIYFVT